ncbi:TonB-dependent receptor [Aliarcobacter butzleri]|uniref:TonB-dependent receptor n=1 Tax=Aliarcobacter butzleri TaxID=28197 RepID=UPI00214CAF5B|nr:TonB-dependent receptor [Aliarcobacter butzleri]MCP3649091.1 TonB-dependent receptor [Arcobacter sp. DNRA7]MCR1815265.1 TonB-dependent receptor [Aliarcobacter butzleri]
MKFSKHALVASSLALVFGVNLFADEVYTIQNKTLKEALEIISKKSNLSYIANDEVLETKRVNNIQNIEGTQQALDKILEGTGLKAVIQNEAIVIVKEKAIGKGTVLEAISVNTGKIGSAENGYLVEDVKTLGVWGNLSLQDTPYSMTVLSSDLLENTITSNMNQVAKVNPVMVNQENASQNGEISTAIRGFGVAQALIDGIPLAGSYFGTSTNEVDRIEVISGLSGFLYGSGNVGGTINYALKYPTLKPNTKISVGNNGGQNYYTSVDTSQNITDKLSVRVFGNYQGGDTAIENYEDEEKLIGVSFAYKPTDNLDLGLYYAHRESTTGMKPTWIIDGKMPNAKDFDTKKLYTPSWANVDVDSDKVELKANYNFSDNLRFRTAYIYKDADRNRPYFYNTIDTNTGNLGRSLYWFYPQTTKNDGAYAYLDSDFDTSFIHHALTFGGSFGTEKFYDSGDHDSPWGASLGSNNINDYNSWNYTIPKGIESKSLARKNFNTNIVLGDNITFTEQWSALIGANYASMENKNGQGVTQYDKSELTPTFSLIYKPIEDLTTYVTYMESLQNGNVIDEPVDTNDGKVFDPLKSKQYEVGAKWSIKEDLLLSTALFRIEKANNMTEYFADNGNGKTQTTTQDGEQINQGVEVLVTGKPTDSLTLMGGVTYLSPKVEKTSNKALEGKESTEVAKYQAKMYAEYRLPVSPKIFLNGGVYYTGTQWVDNANTQKLDAYKTVDFGARYETKLEGYDTTFRIYASNITDEKYWANTTTLSDPRSVAFNVTLKF